MPVDFDLIAPRSYIRSEQRRIQRVPPQPTVEGAALESEGFQETDKK
jgi:hypothetical protein